MVENINKTMKKATTVTATTTAEALTTTSTTITSITITATTITTANKERQSEKFLFYYGSCKLEKKPRNVSE